MRTSEGRQAVGWGIGEATGGWKEEYVWVRNLAWVEGWDWKRKTLWVKNFQLLANRERKRRLGFGNLGRAPVEDIRVSMNKRPMPWLRRKFGRTHVLFLS
jgi:hypothetical protein